jgi:hypothetical protein
MKWLREDLKLARALMPNWPPERWISIAALVVSGFSLLVAADARREESNYRRLSMKPKVAITFNYNTSGAGWVFANSGLGPGVVRSFGVAVDDAPQRNWEAVARLLGVNLYTRTFGTLIPGLMIPQSASGLSVLFWVAPGPGKDLLIKQAERVRIEICYCSLYDECWLASNLVSGAFGLPCTEGKINSTFLFLEGPSPQTEEGKR